jgi:hypothetical protein
MINIKQILDTLQSHHFHGAGDHVEIAKGRNEMITTFSGMKNKLKRITCQKK